MRGASLLSHLTALSKKLEPPPPFSKATQLQEDVFHFPSELKMWYPSLDFDFPFSDLGKLYPEQVVAGPL